MKKYRMLLSIATFLTALTKITIITSACAFSAGETEIPESLQY